MAPALLIKLETDTRYIGICNVIPGLGIENVKGQFNIFNNGNFVFLKFGTQEGDSIYSFFAGHNITGKHCIHHEPVNRNIPALNRERLVGVILNVNYNTRPQNGTVLCQSLDDDFNTIGIIDNITAVINDTIMKTAITAVKIRFIISFLQSFTFLIGTKSQCRTAKR